MHSAALIANLLLVSVALDASTAMAQLERIEARPSSTSKRNGPSGGATDFQLGVL